MNKVKIVNGASGYGIPLNQVCQVLDAEINGVWLDPYRGESSWTRLKFDKLFFSSEFVEAVRDFKVGDKVRVIKDGHVPGGSGHNMEIGGIDVVERADSPTGVYGHEWSYYFHEIELVTEEKKMVDWNKPIEWVADEDVYPAKVVGQDNFDHKIVLADTETGQLFNSFTDAGELTDDFGFVDNDGCDVIRNKSRWANIYVKTLNSSQVEGYVYATREEADAKANSLTRVACVEIP